ncbi:DUF6115 domain-containing protein [Halalkalibacterium halodurans]|uniref:Uncharacterized protein n=1 Tax=Halalkalibacterium halodurans TaxID=86665 RepID=A0A0M0KK66_ALKHA|nr:hypothetical protein [Halalkalibacterium halodurans]TPE69608.1 hypothetical protein AMD02_007485 [Halalkalibacterium halodurans]
MSTIAIISLILHGVTFLWIITLVQKLSLKETETDHKKTVKEIEDLLAAYTLEMKEENEKLLKQFEAMRKVPVAKEPEDASTLATPAKPMSEPEPEAVRESDPAPPEEQEESVPPWLDGSNDEAVIVETSDQSRVISLAKQGLSVEEIAKKLNMGKGEVELLLKFYG